MIRRALVIFEVLKESLAKMSNNKREIKRYRLKTRGNLNLVVRDQLKRENLVKVYVLFAN